MTANGVRRSVPLLIVLGVVLAAVALVLADRWRRGAFVFGIAVLVAAALRLVLSDDSAGLLAVRTRRVDVITMTGVGAAIVWLAVSIDPLGTG